MGALAHTLPAYADTIYACVNNSSGTIKIVAQADVCPNGASKTSWSNAQPTPPPPTDVYVNQVDASLIDPAGTVVAALKLLPGPYLVSAEVTQSTDFIFPPELFAVACAVVDSQNATIARATVQSNDAVRQLGSLTMIGTTQVAADPGQTTGQITLTCLAEDVALAEVFLSGVKLIAHAVGAIHVQP
jgi:hypothetical protein